LLASASFAVAQSAMLARGDDPRGSQPCSLSFGQLRRSPQYLPGGPSPPDPHDRG